MLESDKTFDISTIFHHCEKIKNVGYEYPTYCLNACLKRPQGAAS